MDILDTPNVIAQRDSSDVLGGLDSTPVSALWTKDVPLVDNLAKQLAHHIAGKTAIIEAGALMLPAAISWKAHINQYAKNTAWCSQITESDLSEFVGWMSHPVEKPFAVIDLVSSLEEPEVMKRFDANDRLLSGLRPAAHRIEAEGKTVEEQVEYFTLLGQYVSVYLAMLNGVDPSPVKYIEKLKRESV